MHTAQQKIVDALRLENAGIPIYVQLRDQLLRWVTTGALKPGDQMPTMRQVAVALRIDLNTVRHAYDELERMDVIALIRGRGSFVCDRPPQSPEPRHATDAVDALARQVLHLAAASGIDPHHLTERILHLSKERDF
jgi:GntR family transcriptional regulator